MGSSASTTTGTNEDEKSGAVAAELVAAAADLSDAAADLKAAAAADRPPAAGQTAGAEDGPRAGKGQPSTVQQAGTPLQTPSAPVLDERRQTAPPKLVQEVCQTETRRRHPRHQPASTSTAAAATDRRAARQRAHVDLPPVQTATRGASSSGIDLCGRPAAAAAAAAAAGGVNMPEICRRYSTQQGCPDASCRRVHLCHFFLAGICKFDYNCRSSHSLGTEHNTAVCRRWNQLGRQPVTLIRLQNLADEIQLLPETTYHSQMQICFNSLSAKPCAMNCSRFHICKQFVLGECARRECRFSHNFNTAHNIRVKYLHKASSMPDDDVIAILQKKYAKKVKLTDAAEATNSTSAITSTEKLATEANKTSKEPVHAKKTPESTEETTLHSHPRVKPAADKNTSMLHTSLLCSICLEIMKEPTMLLPCGHSLCAPCADKVALCPECRAEISLTVRNYALEGVSDTLKNQSH